MLSTPLAISIVVAYIGWMLWYSNHSKKEVDKSVEALGSAIETLVKNKCDEAVREAMRLTEEERNTLRYMSMRAEEQYPEVCAADIGVLLDLVARLCPEAKAMLEKESEHE